MCPLEAALEIQTKFSSFGDYWLPLLNGVGPTGAYVASLLPERRVGFMNGVHRRTQQGWSVLSTVFAIVIFGGLVWVVTAPERTASRVTIGMSREEAISAVGSAPKWEGGALAICQDNGWEGCVEAKQSGAVSYLMWHTFIDSDLILGICGNGRVCFKGQRG